MTTTEERLDVLLAMAREVGRLGNTVASLSHTVEWGTRADKANNRSALRKARKDLAVAEARLTKSRESFLKETK